MLRLGKNWLDRFEESVKEGDFFTELFSNIRSDLRETASDYVVTIDIPGFNKDDVNITQEENTLKIVVEKNTNESSAELYKKRLETRIGLSRDVDTDKISATVADGVLTLTIGKKIVESKTIKIIEVN